MRQSLRKLKISPDKYLIYFCRIYSEDMRLLLSRLLQRDPEKRPNITEILEIPLLKDIEIAEDLTQNIANLSTKYDWKVTDLHDKFNSLMKR